MGKQHKNEALITQVAVRMKKGLNVALG